MFKVLSHSILMAAALIVGASCARKLPDAGVPRELAVERKARIDSLSYNIYFDLRKGGKPASEKLRFFLRGKGDVFLDFKTDSSAVNVLCINERMVDSTVVNEHLILPAKNLRQGWNEIMITFVAGEQSLNRREEFLYTLLVPDRARTLFPCFDQPDLKASFELCLRVPQGWHAVSNSPVSRERLMCCGDRKIIFAPTEPLSTYLFSFAAGKFTFETMSRGGRSIRMYHRESDPARTAQCPEVLSQVFDAIEWMEEWTGVKYPFAKYDFVVLPDFQYGGMEHTGATLYNNRSIFLGSHPTEDQLRRRASLIAHETAHMWFGDYVTMSWFNDVWLKEVFANWFAARMIRPLFPDVDYALADLKDYYASAYEEDRTPGAVAISRPLDNLEDAGLIYCNTIYDKAPVVMNFLVEKMGEDAFKRAVRKYLNKYAYGNASWDELLDVLCGESSEELRAWADGWIKQAGMPVKEGLASDMEKGRYIVPNKDGHEYAAYILDKESLQYIMDSWRGRDDVAGMSLLMTLYENAWRGKLDADAFVRWIARELPREENPLVFSSLLGYGKYMAARCGDCAFTGALHRIASDAAYPAARRLACIRALSQIARSREDVNFVYGVWNSSGKVVNLELDEYDLSDIALRLMVLCPEKYDGILYEQSARISNADLLESFTFCARAASVDPAERKEFFASLLAKPENRRPESRVLKALGLLCHPLREEESLEYVLPSLEALPQIQRSGDIFFPASWCDVLLGGRCDERSGEIVNDFLASHRDMNPLLVSKILQALCPEAARVVAPQRYY